MNYFLGIYYAKIMDPQRKIYVEENNFDYIKRFYYPAKKMFKGPNTKVIIFHDHLSKEFIEKYETKNISFVYFSPEGYLTKHITSGNDVRFMVYRHFLMNLEEKDLAKAKVFITDITDCSVLKNPFSLITEDTKDKIFVSPDRERIIDHYWCRECAHSIYKSFDKFEPIKDKRILGGPGLFGGSGTIILEFLDKFVDEMGSIKTTSNKNYMVFQYIAYTYYEDKLIIGELIEDEEKENAYFYHKLGNKYRHVKF